VIEVRASRSMTSASTGRFSDCNKLWHYHWLSLVHLQTSKPRVDEVRAWREPEPSQVNRKTSPSSLYQQTTICQMTLALAF
jgi:hypothetical protein